MMARLLNLSKTSFILSFILAASFLNGQKGEIIPLSKKVGLTLDAEENLFYNVFTDIDGFESAQFYEMSYKTVIAKITFVQYSQQKTSRRRLHMKEFLEMKESVDIQRMITEEDRKLVHENLTYLQTDDILENILEDQYITIKHRSGVRIRGTLKEYKEKYLKIQTPVSLEEIPIWDMESISYRDSILNKKEWKFAIYGLSALAGITFAEGWNLQVRPENDDTWHFRFMGSVLGLLAGREVFQTINILSSPKTFFALTPEEMDKLKE